MASPPASLPFLTLRAAAYAGGARQAPHRHDELHLSLVLRGRVAETVEGVTAHGGPLSVVAKDAGVRHANTFGPGGARLAQLALPGGSIGALTDRPGPSAGWRWTDAPAVGTPFVRLVARHAAAGRAVPADDPDLLDLLAALTAVRRDAPRGQPPGWLAATIERLREEWTPRTSVRDVARRADVHPVYLARAMRRWYGTGVAEELRRLRQRAALAALADEGASVSRVAHAAGYADEAHLCRELRAAVGITPARYRALLASLLAPRRHGRREVARIQVSSPAARYS